jgi:hypothetical protein
MRWRTESYRDARECGRRSARTMGGDVSALVGSKENRRSRVISMSSLTPRLASNSEESVSAICLNASASAIRAKEEDIATWTGSGEGLGGRGGEACYKEAPA